MISEFFTSLISKCPCLCLLRVSHRNQKQETNVIHHTPCNQFHRRLENSKLHNTHTSFYLVKMFPRPKLQYT